LNAAGILAPLYMQRFAQLIEELNNTTKTNDKRDALLRYLQDAPDAGKVWLIAIFSGRRPKRLVNSTLMKSWTVEVSGMPQWLFEECYHTVGDLAETISLTLPAPQNEQSPAIADILLRIQQLQKATEEEKKRFVLEQWQTLSRSARFVFNKIIIGSFRIGVSRSLVVQAVAAYAEKEVQEVAHMIGGNWDPFQVSFADLMHESIVRADDSKPYPFYLAYAMEGGAATLGAPDDWQVEWKWDGIRGQLIRRNDSLYLWSRGEELVTDRFPEMGVFFHSLPDGVVMDGEVLAYQEGKPLPFQYLQTRVTRKKLTKKQLTEAPVVFIAYDLLELNGEDLRNKTMQERRALLETLVSQVDSPYLILSPLVEFEKWNDLHTLMQTARERGCEGFMLKRKSGVYQAGRRRGDWWKWKIDPLTVDAVLVYAQKGHGKRSNLYTDYTFAVRDGEALVPFAKAYSGLTDKEIAAVDRFIRNNSLEQFGPVRTVKPELVFEIAFEGIAASGRHKSGVAVRFPRILRQRIDKNVDEINTLEELKQLLEQYGKK